MLSLCQAELSRTCRLVLPYRRTDSEGRAEMQLPCTLRLGAPAEQTIKACGKYHDTVVGRQWLVKTALRNLKGRYI